MRNIRLILTTVLLAVVMMGQAQTDNLRTRHTVEKSETVFGIAKKYGITIEELVRANPAMNQQGYELKRGDVLNIPYAKGADKPSTTADKPSTTADKPSTTAGKPSTPAAGNTAAVTTPANNAATTPSTNAAKPSTSTLVGRKDVKVGVMLPLHDNDGDGRRMVEYYRGLLLGADRVKKDGITVDMRAWNVPIDGDITKTLQEKGAADCDIIFGPLYTKMVKPLADFCEKHNTTMVIPFSIHGNEVENYANIFQVYQPDAEFETRTIKNFIQWFNNYHVVIIDCADEKSGKGEFMKKLRAELDHLKINYSLTSLATNDKAFAKAFSLSQQNVVILNTEHSPSLNSTLAKLNTLTTNNSDIQISLFGYKEWLMYTSVYRDYYFKYDTYVPSYFYYNDLSADTKWVERNYKKWFEKDMDATALPRFALTGFDHACFFIGGFSQFGHTFKGGKGQMTYKPVQSPLKFKEAGKGHKNTNFMFVHYKTDRTIESVNY
jgi:LysM repeat protein